ncbi:MAG: hypothetical protein RL385_1132 [Pseudomonadota bacterium]|jgi:drug/metabolite transporter (DMT)-like permease
MHLAPTAALPLGYLIAIGSWVGFGSYPWLLVRVSSSSLCAYAYVNPVIAVLLGTLGLDEPFTARTATGSVVILLAVVVDQTATEAH